MNATSASARATASNLESSPPRACHPVPADLLCLRAVPPFVTLASAVLSISLLGASLAASPGGAEARSQSDNAAPADATAGTGPLVGDPSLLPGEQHCVTDEPNAPWFPTIAAFEVHDSNRTHL